MKTDKRIKGDKGEELAVRWLEKNKKFCIIGRNYSTRYGEIDIIARDNLVLVFVEVKFRKSRDFGYPCEAVTFQKQDRIGKSALCYLQENNLPENTSLRFDVIEILDIENDRFIRHTENAFEWSAY